MKKMKPMNPLITRKTIAKINVLVATFYFAGAQAADQKWEDASQTDSISVENAIKFIQSNTNYSFFYNKKNIIPGKKVLLGKNTGDIDSLLKSLSQQTGMKFQLVGNQILILEPRDADKSAVAAAVPIKGKVTDKNGNPVEGVVVRVEGTAYQTTTDEKGNYTLNLPEGQDYILTFALGGQNTELLVTAKEGAFYNITLGEKVQNIEEVVVIGYGSKLKKDVTTAVASVDSKKIAQISKAAPTVDNILGGTMKGVRLNQTSGEPGATANINVRGITSPYPNMMSGQNSNSPLFVIDGVPFFVENNVMNPLLTVSPNDIESIDVLKDAAATAIYGSRGANGVVIIKTKSGKRNQKLSVDLDYTFSVSNPIKQFRGLNTQDYKNFQETVIKNTIDALNQGRSYEDVNNLKFLANIDEVVNPDTGNTYYLYKGLKPEAFGNADTDWVKETTKRNAMAHQYNAAITGGSENTDYSLNLSGMNQQGSMINDVFERYGVRSSINFNINSKIKTGTIFNYSYSKRNSNVDKPGYKSNASPWLVRPDYPVYDENGNFVRLDGRMRNYGAENWEANPVAALQKKNDFQNHQFLGNVYLDYEFLKGLTLHSDLNLSRFTYATRYFIPIISQDQNALAPSFATLSSGDSNTFTSSLNFRLDYKLKKGLSRFNGLIGYGADRIKSNAVSIEYQDFPDNDVQTNPGSAKTIYSFNEGTSKSGLNSVYTRFSYDYDDRYLADLSFRADKSSKFGLNNRWGYFPAVSLAWRINNENFLRDNEKISDLKLRTSWGRTGSTNVPDFSYKQYYARSSSSIYGEQIGIELNSVMLNPDLKWEMTTEYNTGVDFSFFKNRLYGSAEAYYRYTDGALAPAPHIMESGLETYYANIIDMSNKGVEFELGGIPIKTSDFSWDVSFNIASNKSRIVNLNKADIPSYFQDAFIVGEAPGTLKGYIVEKVIQNQDDIDALNEAAKAKGFNFYQQASTGIGDFLYKDINGDGRINFKDREVIARPEPKFFGGINTTLTYKNFSLFALAQFSKGSQALWSNATDIYSAALGRNTMSSQYGNSWTPENPNAIYPQAVSNAASSLNFASNNRLVFDASYFRLKNITLAYNLSDRLAEKLRVRGITLSASLTNILTFTKWPGLDPELVGVNTLRNTTNDDPYPLNKTFSVGTKISF